jgi:basic amino acid/polyamine antiporter, APA family
MARSKRRYKVIDRKVGLLGGTVLLVGTVIGISVFLLPGQLIGEAGPSIVPALAITAIPMLFGILSLLQLGGAMPVAGGVYVYASRLVGPFWGFLAIWLLIPAIWAVLMFTAIGFAAFVRYFVDLPAELLIVGVLLAFLILNLLGTTIVTGVQFVMVAAIGLAMLAFIVPGAAQIDLAHYTPMFPAGVAPFLIAVVALYLPFQGFSMVIEIGEEVKNPVKNIPRMLYLGMAISVVLSFGLVVVFAGLDDWQALGDLGEGGIARAAAVYLPSWIGGVVAVGAVLGAFTTLNAAITSYSRTLMRAARDEVVHPKLAELSATQVPRFAVLMLALPPIVLVPLSPDPITLAVFIAAVVLFGGFLGSIALWNLPKRFPDRYRYSFYKLPMWLLKTVAIGNMIFAVLFWLALLPGAPHILAVLAALVGAGYLSYRRRLFTHERGKDLRDRLTRLDDHE